MKRFLAILLAMALLLTLSACGNDTAVEKVSNEKTEGEKTSTTDTPKEEEGGVEAAQAAIEAADYRKAYDLLKKDGGVEAKQLLEKFAFVPVYASDDAGSSLCSVAYDKNGRPVTKIENSPYGMNNAMFYYYYDDNGRLETVSRTMDDGTFYIGQEYRFTYDESGRVQAESYYERSKPVMPPAFDFCGSTVYSYDEAGNLLSVKKTDSAGVAVNETKYTYDTDGKVLTKNYYLYDDFGLSDRETVYTYDANGKMVAEETSSVDETVKTVYTYDENGNVLTEETTHPSGKKETIEYTYDANGNMLSEEYSHDNFGSVSRRKMVYTYDADGNLSTESDYGQAEDGTDYTKIRTTYCAWRLMYYPDGVPEYTVEMADPATWLGRYF